MCFRIMAGLSPLLVLLPVCANAAGAYAISISKEETEGTSARLPKIDVIVTNTSSKAIRMSTHGHAYSDYKLVIRQADGSVLKRSALGRALTGDVESTKNGVSSNTVFIPMPESGLDGWIDPGKSFVESIDLNELYEAIPGTYFLVVQGRLQNPSGDPVFSSSLRFSLR